MSPEDAAPPTLSRRELRERERQVVESAHLAIPEAPAREYAAPGYTAPEFVAPGYTAPEFSAPGFTAPEFAAPAFTPDMPAAPAAAASTTGIPDFAAFIAAHEAEAEAADDARVDDVGREAHERPARRSRLRRGIRAPRVRPAVSAPRPQRRLGQRVLSGAALLAAGGLMIGVSVPANAFEQYAASDTADTAMLASAATLPGQSVEVLTEEVTDIEASRADFEVKSWAQLLQAKYGNRGSRVYTSTGTGSVRWPFPYYVPISSGFGERAAPCRGCSTTHNAIDLTPGAGVPIYAIADGVVNRREPRGGSWGNNLSIEHTINGQKVQTSYAHMQWDSSPIVLGQTVKVGDFLGLVGATGQATGAHLHLEIKVNGAYVDPYVWLTKNAG